ncbi:hypothetical protein SAMN04489712_109104 [Thermomonospora echinospora]|uniref:DUF6817 domain-containing protein n=2 Tax=Thermomonospora echinospora TaxID=1992 RepID=A0A1H6C9J6_9ACTN|nr:hypothetical protein SAMN04489712_109104 [Thermomonospora echinospora]
MLERWRVRPAVRLAGLCHAFYGTDGFATALGETSRRAELVACIGEEAENLVYFYASCDRASSYPELARGGPFRDRFSGERSDPPPAARRDFAELTVANELDLVEINPEFRERYGPGLRDLFTSWDALLGDAARHAVRTVLP